MMKKIYFVLALFFVIGCMTTKSHVDDLYSRAKRAYDQKRYDESIKYFLKFIEESPNSPMNQVVFFCLADSYKVLEDFDSARMYFQKVVEENKSSAMGKLAQKKIDEIDYILIK